MLKFEEVCECTVKSESLVLRNFEKPFWNWDNGSLRDWLGLVRSGFCGVIQQTFGERGFCNQIPIINFMRHQFQKHRHHP